MIAYSIAPRDFDQTIFAQKNGTWAKSTYLGRDVFGPTSTDSPYGRTYIIALGYNKICPAVTNRAASSPIVSRYRVTLGFQTLALADGDALTCAGWTLAATSGGNLLQEEIQLVRSGSAYSLRLKHDVHGYATLVSGITAGANYTVGVDIYKDLVRPFAQGAYLSDVAGGSAYADRAYSMNFFGSAKFQPWFVSAYIYQGHDGAGSSLVTVNDLPADGEAVYVKKAYLQAGISSGDVVKSDVTAGVIASPPASDGKWLRALHLGGNVFGGSKKVDRTSGTWTDDDWTV